MQCRAVQSRARSLAQGHTRRCIRAAPPVAPSAIVQAPRGVMLPAPRLGEGIVSAPREGGGGIAVEVAPVRTEASDMPDYRVAGGAIIIRCVRQP